MPSRMTRAIAIAASAAILATSVDLQIAAAGSASSKTPGQELGSATATDFSSHRKRRRGGGNAAAFAAIAGTIGAIAAAQAARKRHRHYYGAPAYGYYGGPVYSGYYHGGPVYYGGHHSGYGAPHAYRYRAPHHDSPSRQPAPHLQPLPSISGVTPAN